MRRREVSDVLSHSYAEFKLVIDAFRKHFLWRRKMKPIKHKDKDNHWFTGRVLLSSVSWNCVIFIWILSLLSQKLWNFSTLQEEYSVRTFYFSILFNSDSVNGGLWYFLIHTFLWKIIYTAQFYFVKWRADLHWNFSGTMRLIFADLQEQFNSNCFWVVRSCLPCRFIYSVKPKNSLQTVSS